MPSSFLNTWMFFWIMFCTATVLPSLEKDAPCDQAPIGASAVLVRNLLIYGVGGIIVPFVAIKLIDMLITAIGLA